MNDSTQTATIDLSDSFEEPYRSHGMPQSLWEPEVPKDEMGDKEQQYYYFTTYLRALGRFGFPIGKVRIEPLPRSKRKAVINQFLDHTHRHCGPVQGWTDVLSIKDDLSFFGVLIMGYPVARRLDDGATLEVRRVSLLSGSPKNSASMLLGRAERVAKAKGIRQLISYTLQSEEGISYSAAGWTRDEHNIKPKKWNTASRKRGRNKADTEPKHRWRKLLT